MFDTADTNIVDTNRLYHFTKAKNIIRILRMMRLKPGVFQKSNDLFEERPNVFMGNNVMQQRELEQYINNHITFLSFAKDVEDPHKCRLTFQRSPMWGVYAEANAGACLVLNEEHFVRENNILINGLCYPPDYMNYEDVIPQRYETKIIPSIENYVRDECKFLFYYKQKCWEFENEYRYVFVDAPKYLSIKDSLIGVILGHRFCKLEKIRELYQLSNSRCRKVMDDPYYWAVQGQHSGVADITAGIHPMIDEFFPKDLDYNEDC